MYKDCIHVHLLQKILDASIQEQLIQTILADRKDNVGAISNKLLLDNKLSEKKN